MRLPLAIAAAFAAVALAGPAVAASAEDIIGKEKCSKCHKAETSKKGPSFADLAKKYKGKDVSARLFTQLKNGGKVGEEEDHKKLAASDDEIKAVVQYVLSAK